MKIVKIGLLAFAVLALLLVIGLVAAVNFFEINRHHERISQMVYNHTGRELQLYGDLEWGLWPKLYLAGGPLSLGNAPNFGPEPFLHLESFHLAVVTSPLLRSKLLVSAAKFTGLRLNLARNQAGVTNWQDLTARMFPAPPPKAAPPFAVMALGGVQLQDVLISWQDEISGQTAEIRDLELQIEPLALGDPIQLNLNFIANSEHPKLQVITELSGTALYDLKAGQYSLKPLEIAAAFSGPTVPGGRADLTLRARLDLDTKQEQLQVNTDLIKAQLGVSDSKDQPEVNDFNAPPLSLTASANLDVKEIFTSPNFTLNLDLPSFNPRQLMALLKRPIPETADAKALSRLALNTKISGTPGKFTVKPIDLRLDDSHINGELTMRDLNLRDISYKIEIDQIDLDRYLPPTKEKRTITPDAAVVGAALLPLELLRSLRIAGEKRAAKLKISGLTLENLVLGVKAADGQINVTPLAATLYGGRMVGQVNLDARGQQPIIKSENRLSGIQVGPLLRDFTGKQEWLRGQANIDYRLHTTGATFATMKANINGEANFSVTNGTVAGVDIDRLLRQANALLQGGALPVAQRDDRTDFTSFSGSLQIKNGLISNHDLSLISPLLRISGKGSAHLVTEQVDYRLRAAVIADPQDRKSRDLARLQGIAIPIQISGNFASLSYRPDLSGIGLDLLKDKIRQRGGPSPQERRRIMELLP